MPNSKCQLPRPARLDCLLLDRLSPCCDTVAKPRYNCQLLSIVTQMANKFVRSFQRHFPFFPFELASTKAAKGTIVVGKNFVRNERCHSPIIRDKT